MPTKERSLTEPLAENEDLRLRLDEAEETLRAVWSGEVDALVVSGSEDNRILTLKGSDKPYHVLVEAMNEGAVTLGGDGTILYCNSRFAEMVKVPHQQVIGSSIHRFVAPADGDKVTRLPVLRKGGPCGQEIAIMAVDGVPIPCQFSVAPLVMGNLSCVCAVVTDLTEINKTREALRKASYELKGRLKELKCLYSFAEIARRQDLSLDRMLEEIVELIPPACQHPEIACARILFDGKELSTAKFRPTPWRLTAPIDPGTGPVGAVEVCYLAECPSCDEGPFLNEERGLLDTLAKRISEVSQRKQAQEALLQSESVLRSFYENAPMLMGIVELTEDDEIVHIYDNAATARFFGVDYKSTFNKSARDLGAHNGTIHQWVECYRQSQETGKPVRFEYLHPVETGQLWLSVIVSTIGPGPSGRMRFSYVAGDVTERKLAEERLRGSEEILRYIVNHDPNAIAVYDLNLCYVAVSKRYIQDYNVKEADIIGKHHYEVFPEMPQKWKDAHQRCLAGAVESNDDDYFERPDGSITHNRWECRPWYRANGQIGGIITYTEVTTERKLAEKKLHDHIYFLQELIDSIPNPVFFKNLEGIFQGCNKAYEEFLGLSKAEIVGKTIHEIMPGDLADRYHEMDLRLLREGGAQVNELKVQRSNGDERSVFLNNAIYLDADGRIGGLVGSVIDITERKRLEEQLRQVQKMEAIGTLAGGIAHDFNNILGIILGYAEIASFDVSKDSQTYINLEQVRHAARRATDLVRQILAFSRRREQHRDPLLVTPVVKECLKLLRASIPSTIEICQELDMSTGEDKILADPTQIHQVLMNLCANASHAMRKKGGILTVSLSEAYLEPKEIRHLPDLSSGPYVKITVSDTGHGIDPAVMDRIFEPYFTTKGLGEGTGLGLAVVHGIVKEHRGTITVRSELDRGTTFDVFFPKIEKEIIEDFDDFAVIPKGKGSILFVDDEPAIMDIGMEMLQRLGYKVTARSSSTEALEAFRSQPDRFDMIITDQTMPHMTGVELTREVLSIRPGIPIVICTGFSESVSPERAKDLGVREVVMKPMVMSQIAGIIRRILDERGEDKRQ